MSGIWQARRLGELAELITKGTTPTSIGHSFAPAGVTFVKVESISQGGAFIGSKLAHITEECHAALRRSQLQAGDILFSIAGALGRTAVVTEEILPANTNQALAIIRLRRPHEVLPEFVLKALTTGLVLDQIEQSKGGVAQQNLSLAQVQAMTIPVPPHAEQRRIVAFLDEAFDSIAAAKINVEKYLQNLRDLVDSLSAEIFARLGVVYGSSRLGDVVERLTNGFVGPTRDIYVEQGVPYLLARHVRDNQLKFDGRTFVTAEFNDKHKKSKLRRGDVLLVQSGHIGHAAVVGPDHDGHNCHAMIVMTPVEGVLVGEYLSYFFNSPAMRRSFESIRSGSTVPHLTCGAVKELRIPLPSVAEQWQVINQLDELEAQISRLREIASVKLAALDELKLSVLHQAFGGQLTSDKPMSTVSCPPLQSTSPEFSATIIALDYERHRRRQRENTCGRVKGQKVLHLAEARAKLDLGRRPIKDAAGPNDFQHMLKAEAWAKQNDFFEMVPRDGGGYDFKPLPAYEALLARTPEVLGDSRERIEAVIDLVIPLDTKATEVLATVYAAWNNLLMDGVTVTDESIVRAARDDWHPDKLCIPVSKFREAIAFIRSKGLVPDGTGKYVGGQQSLQLQ